jgi:hypothetical protein
MRGHSDLHGGVKRHDHMPRNFRCPRWCPTLPRPRTSRRSPRGPAVERWPSRRQSLPFFGMAAADSRHHGNAGRGRAAQQVEQSTAVGFRPPEPIEHQDVDAGAHGRIHQRGGLRQADGIEPTSLGAAAEILRDRDDLSGAQVLQQHFTMAIGHHPAAALKHAAKPQSAPPHPLDSAGEHCIGIRTGREDDGGDPHGRALNLNADARSSHRAGSRHRHRAATAMPSARSAWTHRYIPSYITRQGCGQDTGDDTQQA